MQLCLNLIGNTSHDLRSPPFPRIPQQKNFQGVLGPVGGLIPSQRLFIAHPRGIFGFIKTRNQRHFTLIRPCLQSLICLVDISCHFMYCPSLP